MARLDPSQFDLDVLQSNGIEVAFGVPDSSLSGLLSYFSAVKSTDQHIVVASEGAAVALAVGYHLATGKIALVYVQNSGLANALNPLQSIAAKEVFGIPMLLMVGWRGKPGERDEPQHALIGPRLLENIKANGLPFEEMPSNLTDARATVARLVATAKQENTPVALVVPRDTYAEYRKVEGPSTIDASSRGYREVPRHIHTSRSTPTVMPTALCLSRELVIRHTLDFVQPTDVTVASLGGTSRELYMVRKERGDVLGQDFFCIGGMGHSFALARGLALGGRLSRIHRVWCIDGDGSFLMHLGNNAVLAGLESCDNVVHIVTFNGVYSSTGNQPLMMTTNHFLNVAGGLPYRRKVFVEDETGLRDALADATNGTLIVVLANDRVSASLPRPLETCADLKTLFIANQNRRDLYTV